VALCAAVGVRVWNALAGPLMWGYDAWGHVAYVLFLDLYRSVPWADQGWSYFHPPLHYALGWVLAQSGSSEVLVRGLALLGGVTSLATAALAAQLVRMSAPERGWLPPLAFAAVALMPLHLFMSNMPGNEMTLTFLTAAAMLAFIANEARTQTRLGLDVLCGVFVGLALLTKFSGLVPLLVVLGALGLRPIFSPSRGTELRRCLLRGVTISGVALLLAAPYYTRNVGAFGTPFQLSRDYPLIIQVEADQPPGERGIGDYFRFSPRMFSEPNPLAEHMLHSVWGTVYLNFWADVFRESDRERALDAEGSNRPTTTAMALAGLVPTALAIFGALLAARDVRAGRRRSIYGPLLLLSGATLASFAIFAWRVPIWSALKASYLLGLSLPYGVFLARALEQLAHAGPLWRRIAGPAWVAAISLAAAVIALEGVVLPARADAPATGAVRFHFAEYPAASRVYGRLVTGARYKVPWLDSLAAVNLANGHPDRARQLYARAVETGPRDPYRRGRLAVAMAVAGDLAAARGELDTALAEAPLPEILANRGAVRAALGDWAGAEADLRAGLEQSEAMVPAWHNLARVLLRAGRAEDGARVWLRAQDEACAAPRGYPYGLGTGEVLEWGVGRRWLLVMEDEGLHAAKPAFYRGMCAAFRAAADPGALGESG